MKDILLILSPIIAAIVSAVLTFILTNHTRNRIEIKKKAYDLPENNEILKYTKESNNQGLNKDDIIQKLRYELFPKQTNKINELNKIMRILDKVVTISSYIYIIIVLLLLSLWIKYYFGLLQPSLFISIIIIILSILYFIIGKYFVINYQKHTSKYLNELDILSEEIKITINKLKYK